MRYHPFSRRERGVGFWPTLLVVSLVFLLMLLIQVIRRIMPFTVEIRQQAQLAAMMTALELRANEFAGYPPSDANDPTGVPYGGALKLCEAVMGRDLLGVHSESVFGADGLDATGTLDLYPDVESLGQVDREANLTARRGPYFQPEKANAYRLVDIYGKSHTGPFDESLFVLCDIYIRKRPSGVKTGMPILYYRADRDGTTHDVNDPDNSENIYDYRDNQVLLSLGVPGEPNAVHPLSDPRRFYMNTQSDKIVTQAKPYNADSFIFISAGYDGLYGTADDICNFWKYRE
jgi:hypothetical protein